LSRAFPAALLALTLSLPAGGESLPASPPASESIVDVFLDRADEQLTSYHGRRVMSARNDRFRKEGWLEADVSFDVQRGLTYSVVASGGSSYVVDRVLVAALRGEAEMWQRGEPARHTFTPENYAFRVVPAADDEQEVVGIAITPRRQHVLLFDGVLFVSPDDADLLRLEGRLSKSPSFWVSRVDVVRRYTRIRGVRVPVELESRAQVRLAGLSWMQMQYLYSSINGLPAAEPQN
jgi:hypothetical protein